MTNETMDVGVEALRTIFGNLRIDQEWALTYDRAFVWWPHTLKQTVWVSEPFDSDGYTIYRLTAATDLVQVPDLEPREVDRRLGLFATGGGALVYNPAERMVQL